MDPQIRRRRTQDAIKRNFLLESLNQPMILVFEDLHHPPTCSLHFVEWKVAANIGRP